MKKLVALFSLFLALSFSLQAEKTELGTYEIPRDQKERIVLENEIGKAEFLNPELVHNLVNCKVVRITYVYSAYAPHGFNQKQLNENRIQNLHELVDFDQEKIKWDEVAQTDCRTGSCAKEMLHGFVIDFVPKSTFHYGRIDKQSFKFSARQSKRIKGKDGTQISIPANSFIYVDGTPVKGEVQLELREALDFENIVKGNLLTMTAEGDLLQTGGMIQVQAYSNGKNLEVKEGRSLDISIPNEDKRDGMQFYSGDLENGNVVWDNPVELGIEAENEVKDEEIELISIPDSLSPWTYGFTVTWTGIKANSKGIKIDQFTLVRNNTVESIALRVDDVVYSFRANSYTASEGREIGLESKQALAISKFFKRTNIILPSELDKIFNQEQTITNNGFGWLGGFSMNNARASKESNTSIDYDLVNSFSMRKLGWANIDRLAKYPNTYQGDIIVDLKNLPDSSLAAISLVIPDEDVFIPAYKMPNGKYSFKQGEHVRTVPLPRNVTGYIIATYNDGKKDYFGTKKIRIGSREEETLSMLQRNKKIALQEIERLF